MRNDARPIGRRHGSPTGGVDTTGTRGAVDERDRAPRDRQSRIVNRRAEDDAPRSDADADPVMPARDSSMNTKI